jgi:antitoxin HigA-1
VPDEHSQQAAVEASAHSSWRDAEGGFPSRQSINELVRERRAVSPEMALRLSRLFGNSAEFRLNAQRAVDLWDAAQALKEDVARIEPPRVG